MPSCCPPGGYCPAHQAMLDRVDRIARGAPGATPPSLPARGRVTTPVLANKLEERYAAYLALRQHAGDLHQWWAKPGSIRLGHHHHYQPDFLLQLSDGLLQYHDTKGGRIREDSWKAMKMAAHLYPCFVFMVVQEDRGRWVYTEVHR